MPDTIVVWTSFLFGVVAMIVSLMSFAQSARSAQRDSYQAVHGMLTDLTTGDVEDARNVLGILRYGVGNWQAAITCSGVVEGYYTVKWALERTAYGLDSLSVAGRRIQRSMAEAVTWHLQELVTTLSTLRAAISRDLADDAS